MRQLLNLLASNAKRGSFRAEGNTIYLYDVIVGSEIEAEYFGGVAPQSFANALADMTGDVHLRINSPGGDVFAGRAIAQAIREYPGQVIAHVDGIAASAASYVAIAADRVVMAPGAMLMIHNAWTFAMGNSSDLMDTAALLEKIDGTLAETYAAKGNGDEAHYASLMASETWFTPAEAVAEGLADEVATVNPDKGAKASLWNLKAYGGAPDAPSEPAEPDTTEHDQRVRLHAVRMASNPA